MNEKPVVGVFTAPQELKNDIPIEAESGAVTTPTTGWMGLYIYIVSL